MTSVVPLDEMSAQVRMLTRLLLPQNAAEAQEFDEQWMEGFVQGLSSFDRRMNEAVVHSGILKHIPKGALGQKGEPSNLARSQRSTILCMATEQFIGLAAAPAMLMQSCHLLPGRGMSLRPGAVSLLQRARRHRILFHVLSVSWSSEMLQGALRGKVPVALR